MQKDNQLLTSNHKQITSGNNFASFFFLEQNI
jgi:hypothetical protein